MDTVAARSRRMTRRGIQAGALALLGVGVFAATRIWSIGSQQQDAARPVVPALERTLILDADWIGEDNPRGRHAKYWVDSWLERHPSYKIDYQAKGDVIVRLASDSYGHMIQFPPTIFALFKGQPGLFVDLTAEMRRRGLSEDDFFGIPQIETWQGRRFGLPLQTNVNGWMYNRGKFEQRGVPLPTESWTYEDAIEAGRPFTHPEAGQWGLRWIWNWGVLPIFWSANLTYLTDDKERVTLDTPDGMGVLEFVLDVIHRHRVAPTDQWRETSNATWVSADILLQFYAMVDNAVGTKATAQRLEPTGITWENMWPPRWKATGKRSTLIDGHPWMTMNHAVRDGVDAACIDLMVHLLDEDVQEQYLIHSTGMPTLKKMAYDERYVGPPPESLRLVPEIWKAGRTYDRFAGEIDMLQAWTPLLQQAWNGEMGAQELAIQLSRDGTAAIQRVARPPWGR